MHFLRLDLRVMLSLRLGGGSLSPASDDGVWVQCHCTKTPQDPLVAVRLGVCYCVRSVVHIFALLRVRGLYWIVAKL